MPRRELLVFETTTGRVREVLPTTALSWNTPLGTDGKIEATVPLGTPDTQYVDVRTLTTPWRFSLAVVQSSQVLGAGVITGERDWSSDNPQDMKITASELWELFARRPLLGDYVNTDPLTDVTFNSATLPGLAAAIVNHAVNVFPNGGLPLVIPELEPGSDNTRTYTGTDLKDTKAALDDLTKVQNGPDVTFDAELVESGSRVQWVMRVGRPLLTQSGHDLVLDYPGEQASLEEDEDASGIATTMIVTAQPQEEQPDATATDTTATTDTSAADTEQKTLVARSDNPELFDYGYPAMWSSNGDHTSVSEQDTLNAYAESYAEAATMPVVERPFTIRTDHPDYPLGTYNRGDTVQIAVGDHPWIRPGVYRTRITDIAVADEKVTITVAEQPGAL